MPCHTSVFLRVPWHCFLKNRSHRTITAAYFIQILPGGLLSHPKQACSFQLCFRNCSLTLFSSHPLFFSHLPARTSHNLHFHPFADRLKMMQVDEIRAQRQMTPALMSCMIAFCLPQEPSQCRISPDGSRRRAYLYIRLRKRWLTSQRCCQARSTK